MGNREAEIRLAILAVRNPELSTGMDDPVAVLGRAVREGSVLAEVALGYCNETGYGVPKNTPEAARLYMSGARRGSQDAYRALRRLLDAIRPSDTEFRVDDFALQ